MQLNRVNNFQSTLVSLTQNKNVGLGAQTYLNTTHSIVLHIAPYWLLIDRQHKHTYAQRGGQQ